MKKNTLSLIFFFILAFTPSFATAEDYLRPATPKEVKENLAEINLTDCDDFLAAYTNTSTEDLKSHIIEITSYDKSICHPQNLYKAKDMYQALYADDNSIMMYFIPRLAVIYEFGPDDIRDIDRAEFLYKQSVIYWALLDISQKLPEMFNKILLSQNLPPKLKKEIIWLQEHDKKAPVQQREQANKLKQLGFKKTDKLWSDLDFVSEIPIKN